MKILVLVILSVLILATVDMLFIAVRSNKKYHKEHPEDIEYKKSFLESIIYNSFDLLVSFLKLIYFLIVFAPVFLVFHFMPWWFKIIVIVLYIVAKTVVPVVGFIFELIIWISAFICSFMIPIDAAIIVFYVLFALWVLFRIVPGIINLIRQR